MSRRILKGRGPVPGSGVVSSRAILFGLEVSLASVSVRGSFLWPAGGRIFCFGNPVSLSISAMSDFHERFDISVDIEAERQKFINRVCNRIFDTWDYLYGKLPPLALNMVFHAIVSELGIRHDKKFKSIYNCINTDNYLEVLRGIEIIYNKGSDPSMKLIIDRDMNNHIISKSELDLGIRWQNGKFIRTGAKLFDEKIVDDLLKWLGGKGYKTIIEPFEQARNHLLESESRPQVLSHVITKSYEALEALSLILVGKSNLRGNQELFVKKVNGDGFHKKILKEYVEYGCLYRHPPKSNGSSRPQLSIAKAEFFFYFTGTFIRLAMENWEDS